VIYDRVGLDEEAQTVVRRYEEALVWCVYTVLSLRLLWRAYQSAIELLVWDQWDFWTPLFTGAGPWACFRWQHGPHRQGLGGLVLWVTATLSGFSVRTEAIVSSFIIIAGAGIFLLFVRKTRGSLDFLDVVFPFILLNGLLPNALVRFPNPAHGPVPFLLLCLIPFCLRIESIRIKATTAAFLTVACMYTAFALCMVPLLLTWQVLETIRSSKNRASMTLALASSVLGVASFFIDYTPNSANPNFAKIPTILEYVQYVLLVLGRPFVSQPLNGFDIGKAFVIASSMPVAAMWGFRRLLTRPSDKLGAACFLLSGFTIVFATAAAVGRASMGVGTALSWTRYIPYVLPGTALLVLVLRERTPVRTGRLVLCLLAASLVANELSDDFLEDPLGKVRQKRITCIQMLRSGEPVGPTIQLGDVLLYPDPNLSAKIEFLRVNKLGLFSPGYRVTQE